jgi:hypothetical protein
VPSPLENLAEPGKALRREAPRPQLKAQFLIDRGGIVRWANFECAKGLAELGKMASDEEILAAVRTLR